MKPVEEKQTWPKAFDPEQKEKRKIRRDKRGRKSQYSFLLSPEYEFIFCVFAFCLVKKKKRKKDEKRKNREKEFIYTVLLSCIFVFLLYYWFCVLLS